MKADLQSAIDKQKAEMQPQGSEPGQFQQIFNEMNKKHDNIVPKGTINRAIKQLIKQKSQASYDDHDFEITVMFRAFSIEQEKLNAQID